MSAALHDVQQPVVVYSEAQQAAAELLARRRGRSSLVPFMQYCVPSYGADPFHNLLGTFLDGVIAGDIKRGIISAPPQHGKSMLVSRGLPALWFGKRPDDPVILTSYGASLAESHSAYARNLVESTEYSRLFPEITTDNTSRAVNHWQIKGKRGELHAVGVGGPITGHGAMLGIIDDPFENWKQAQSETIRKSVWEWYTGTFRERIWHRGAILIVMTRWHDDDLVGRLLKGQAHKWEVMRLPAIAESQKERDGNDEYLCINTGRPEPLGRSMVHVKMFKKAEYALEHHADDCPAPDKCEAIRVGEPLAPTRYPIEALLEIKDDIGSMEWAAEYQGVPRAAAGNMFQRVWLEGNETESHYVRQDDLPADLILVRYWDKAGTEGAGSESCGVLLGLSQLAGLYYCIDVEHGQWSTAKRDKIIKKTAERDARTFGKYKVDIWHEQEPGSSGKESAQNTNALLLGYPVHADKVTGKRAKSDSGGSKEVRARPLASAMENGFFRLVLAGWNKIYIDRFIEFPNGKLKDMIDASSGAFNKLAKYPRREKRRGALARAVGAGVRGAPVRRRRKRAA